MKISPLSFRSFFRIKFIWWVPALPVFLLALHYASIYTQYAEDAIINSYSQSKLQRYITAIRSYEDTGTAIVPKSDLHSIIERVSNHYSISPTLINALIRIESSFKQDAINFNPHLENKYGKMGSADHSYMQVNGQWINTRMCPEARKWNDLYIPEINITCGTRILHNALEHTSSVEDALVVYNCGKVNCERGKEYAKKISVVLMNEMFAK